MEVICGGDYFGKEYCLRSTFYCGTIELEEKEWTDNYWNSYSMTVSCLGSSAVPEQRNTMIHAVMRYGRKGAGWIVITGVDTDV